VELVVVKAVVVRVIAVVAAARADTVVVAEMVNKE